MFSYFKKGPGFVSGEVETANRICRVGRKNRERKRRRGLKTLDLSETKNATQQK